MLLAGDVVEHREEVLCVAAVVANGDLADLDQPEALRRINVMLGRGDDAFALQCLKI